MPAIVVPDLAGWRRERMPDAVGDEDAPPYYELSPDWACEVLSPRTEAFDRGEKVPLYVREGVKHIWLVDPIEQTLEVFRLEREGYLLLGLHHGDARPRAEPFDAIELDLAVLSGTPKNSPFERRSHARSKSAIPSIFVVTSTCAAGGPIRNIPRGGRSADSFGSAPTNSSVAARMRATFALSVATSRSTSLVARTSP